MKKREKLRAGMLVGCAAVAVLLAGGAAGRAALPQTVPYAEESAPREQTESYYVCLSAGELLVYYGGRRQGEPDERLPAEKLPLTPEDERLLGGGLYFSTREEYLLLLEGLADS